MILVTGGAGYIGSHVNAVLQDHGISTIVLDDLSLGHRELVPAGLFVNGDFGDHDCLADLFHQNNIDAIVHLAAYTDVDDSIKRPKEYYENNVTKTLTMLDSAREFGINKFVFSSTSAVYADDLSGLVGEEDVKAPICPYGRTKLMTEQVLEDYRIAYGLNYVAFRYFNASGADPKGRIGEWHDPEVHLIPVILDVALGRRENIKIFGTDYPTQDGTCVRDYIHVMDIAAAHLQAIDFLLQGQQSQIFNLGYGRGYSVLEVIETARKVTGRKINAIPSDRRPGDVAVAVADNAKARDVLHWTPAFDSLEDIIDTAWRWHRKLHSK